MLETNNKLSEHPSICFIITGYEDKTPPEVKAAYPLHYKFAHIPSEPRVKYIWHKWPDYVPEDDHKVHTCQFCHPQQRAVENYSGNVQD